MPYNDNIPAENKQYCSICRCYTDHTAMDCPSLDIYAEEIFFFKMMERDSCSPPAYKPCSKRGKSPGRRRPTK
jgi:hypothetical protein